MKEIKCGNCVYFKSNKCINEVSDYYGKKRKKSDTCELQEQKI